MHLRTGQLICFTGRVPDRDPFSASAAGAPWITHEWLWQVITWQIYRIGQWFGLYALRYACLIAAIAGCLLTCAIRGIGIGAACIAAALAIAPLAALSEIRPQLASYGLFAVVLGVLEMARKHPRSLFFLPLLMLLWANLHGAFLLGFVLCGLVIVAWYLESRAAGRYPGSVTGPIVLPVRTLIIACAISALAALINPHTWHIYLFPIKVIGEGLFRSSIYEWTPPELSLAFAPFWCFLAIACGATIVARKQLRLQDWLILTVFALAAIRSRRQIPFFALVAIPLLGHSIQTVLNTWKPRLFPRFTGIAFLLLTLSFLACANAAYRKALPARSFGLAPGRFPETAAHKLGSFSGGGSVLNDYNDGGFLIWRLYPEWPVTMDGRADVYGAELVRKYQDVWAGKAGWSQRLDEWHVNAILGRYEITAAFPKHNLYHELAQSPEWSLVYWDDTCVLYLRNGGVLDASRMKPYRRLHPGLRWPEIAAMQKTAEDWLALGADIRKALSENRHNQRAKRLERFYQEHKR